MGVRGSNAVTGPAAAGLVVLQRHENLSAQRAALKLELYVSASAEPGRRAQGVRGPIAG
jgi:hypothetical protein